MRVFFDGVPPIEESSPAANSKITAKKEAQPAKNDVSREAEKAPEETKSQVVFHVPYLEKQCESCHDTKFSQKLVAAPKELCFTCHDDFTKDKKVIHYPVSDGACLECHDPHQSPNKALLKKSMPEVCYSCHDEKDIKANPMHEGQSACSECHSPHASNEEKLLK